MSTGNKSPKIQDPIRCGNKPTSNGLCACERVCVCLVTQMINQDHSLGGATKS